MGTRGKKADKAPAAPDRVAEQAYGIWEREGRPEGRDVDHWLRAELELSEAPSPAAKRGAAKKASQATGGPGARKKAAKAETKPDARKKAAKAETKPDARKKAAKAGEKPGARKRTASGASAGRGRKPGAGPTPSA